MAAWLRALAGLLLLSAAAGLAAAPAAPADLQFWRLPEDLDVATVILEAELRRDPRPVHELARDARAGVRARAVLAIGRVALPTSLPWLQEAARDEQPSVRAAAAFALGLLQYELDLQMSEATRQRAAAVLLGLLEDVQPEVAALAAAAIGAVGAGADELRVWLAGAGARPAAVTAEAVGSWWRLRPAEASPLAPFIDAADPYLRLQVAHALHRSSDPDRGPLLARLLQDDDVEVRIMALRGLSFAPARLAHEKVPPFLQMGEWREQCEALAWLGAAWRREPGGVDQDVFVQVVRRALDRNIHTRGCALRALGALGEHAVASDLLLEGLGDVELSVRLAAVEALTDMPPRVQQEAADRLGPLSSIESPLLGAASVALLARAGRLNVPALEQLVAAPEVRVAVAALEELERRDVPAAWRAARLALMQANVELASTAAATIGRLAAQQGDAGQVAAAGDDLWRAFADRPEMAVRTASFDAMARFAGDVLARRRVLLQEIDEPLLRRRAAAFLGERAAAGGDDLQVAAQMLLPRSASAETSEEARTLAMGALQLQDAAVQLRLETVRGVAVLRLRADLAPLTALRILKLVDAGALDDAPFYRVIPAFVAQGGPPASSPWSGATLPSEETPVRVTAGTVGMALAGRDTGTTQLWIATAAQPHLQGAYPIFAEVVEGARAIARIQPGDTMRWSRVQERP